ncbi:MAG: hypothetical protein ABSH17_12225 [Syntrophobacteraceae bacterium]
MIRILEFLDEPKGYLRFSHWGILLIGLFVWTAVQSALVMPIWSRAMLPDVEDSVAYLVRTQEMQECFSQDCPALQDLREQLEQSPTEPESLKQREIASFPFPIYHPLFSIILLGVAKCGVDLTTAYKVVWSIAPFFFGLAIAYLLTVLWGMPAAGVTLVLLAFKVFPDRGVHYVIPTGLAMGLAMLMWARIIFRRGNSPWTLIIGSMLLIAMHPAGAIFALMSIFIALAMPGRESRWKLWAAVLGVILTGLLTFALALYIKRPTLVHAILEFRNSISLAKVPGVLVSNVTGVLVHLVKVKDAQVGSLPVLFASVLLGFLILSRERLSLINRTLSVYALFMLGALFYSHRLCSPGDLFLRLWFPFFVILFGAVGNTICFTFQESLALLKEHLMTSDRIGSPAIHKLWPVLALALVLGYSAETMLSGGEQLYVTSEFLRNCQPLNIEPAQTRVLLSLAKPGDKVLYTSMLVMGSYFANGAMQLGAVYYHAALAGNEFNKNWLENPHVAFAATYNPTIYHPTYAGLDEKRWRITLPDVHFSPLIKPLLYSTISREGLIPAADYKFIDVRTSDADAPDRISLFIKNTGNRSEIEVIPLSANGEPLSTLAQRVDVPAHWSGWLGAAFPGAVSMNRLRIIPSKREHDLFIGGIVYGDDEHNWPWAQKADLILHAIDPWTGEVMLSFDPAKILPSPLNALKIKVLDDNGSSVLFGFDR